MNNFTQAAYDPVTRRVRGVQWLDDYFGPHSYGVRFDIGGTVYRPHEVDIPLDIEFVREADFVDARDKAEALSSDLWDALKFIFKIDGHGGRDWVLNNYPEAFAHLCKEG